MDEARVAGVMTQAVAPAVDEHRLSGLGNFFMRGLLAGSLKE
jgi:hypothetical protein